MYPLTSRKSARVHKTTLALILAAGFSLSAHAATIDWGLATTIGGDTDVSLLGTALYAFNIGSATAQTVNGITFLGSPTGSGAFGGTYGTGEIFLTTSVGGVQGTGNFAGSGSAVDALSASYKALVGNGAFTSTAGKTISLTLNNLTIGNLYSIQIWVDDGVNTNERGVSLNTAGGTAVGLDVNTTNAAGGVGQFSIGTFTADATSQLITISPTSTNTDYLNAVQVRTLSAVPEPTTWVLLGISGLAFLVHRRRVHI